LLTKHSFWSKAERERIDKILKDIRNTSAWHELGLKTVRSNWPWDSWKISVKKLEGIEISVKKVVEIYRNGRAFIQNEIDNKKGKPYEWLSQKKIPNKRQDIFWRLITRELFEQNWLEIFENSWPTSTISNGYTPEWTEIQALLDTQAIKEFSENAPCFLSD
ncbi:17741_t:CDS:2, partial [Gigaspora rosea]